jgi:hypothetical protein
MKDNYSQQHKDELKIAAYLVSTARLDWSAQGETIPYKSVGATFEECLSQTGLTEERAVAAIERLNKQGAGITIG